MEKTSYQTEDIKYDPGTPAAKYTKQIELDSHYDLCDGIQVFEISNGGVPYFQIGLDDKNTFYNQLVHKGDYMSAGGVDPNQRYKAITIPAVNGNKINVNTYIPNDLVTPLYYQIVFRLKRKE